MERNTKDAPFIGSPQYASDTTAHYVLSESGIERRVRLLAVLPVNITDNGHVAGRFLKEPLGTEKSLPGHVQGNDIRGQGNGRKTPPCAHRRLPHGLAEPEGGFALSERLVLKDLRAGRGLAPGPDGTGPGRGSLLGGRGITAL